MAYLPKNKYTLKYTNGEEYRLFNSENSYKGPYIELLNGQRFAGNDISDLKGKLVSYKGNQEKNINYSPVNNRVYAILKPKLTNKIGNFVKIPTSSPKPTADDYTNGFFFRFMVARLNTKQYFEISQNTFKNFNTKHDTILHKTFIIKWSLKENNEEENTKSLREKETYLPGIFDFFPYKNQYGLKNGVVILSDFNRIYPDGEIISKNLPAAYQKGNPYPNTLDNQDVPSFEHCKSCSFYKNNNCSKWQAPVKYEYWCRAYDKKKNTPSPSTPQQPSTPPIVPPKRTISQPNISTPRNRGGSY